MRGYETNNSLTGLHPCVLRIPMRGYEDPFKHGRPVNPFALRIPMRGYERLLVTEYPPISPVTNPHAGL